MKENISRFFYNISRQSQKYIKNADYDKYAREINNSELHKHIIERSQNFIHYIPDMRKTKNRYA